jgi:hypothetical protein
VAVIGEVEQGYIAGHRQMVDRFGFAQRRR